MQRAPFSFAISSHENNFSLLTGQARLPSRTVKIMETTPPPVINCTRRHFGFPQQQMPISEKARAFTLSEK
jgi:hypothetical protein